MERITDLIARLKDYQDNINKFMEAATIQAADTITDMNIGQLYDLGENRDEEKIRPAYAPATVEIKMKKGQPTNRVTLRDTFEWQSSFYIQYYQEGFEIMAGDWKIDRLKAKYGDEILGLQDDNVRYLLENVYQPKLIEELKNAIYES